MTGVTLILALLLAPLVLLTLCFATEVIFGLRRLPEVATPMYPGSSAVIIVPAHDEEPILASRLEALKIAATPDIRILLVADNCTDGTAKIGRRIGVEVIERFDAARRGKGFALDFARRHLHANPPEVVLIIDADCATDEDSIARLIAHCLSTGSPCQATYLQAALPDSSTSVQLSTFAFFVKNVIRQRGLQRLARRALLLGSGMALPWEIFAWSELATGNIVEDLKLGQDLAEAGYSPLFVEEAIVWSNAETETNTFSQRSRWEGGFLENALTAGPATLYRSLQRRDAKGLWGAIHLMIPPFALLFLLDLVGLIFAAAASWITGAHIWPLIVLAASLSLAFLALALAWRAGGWRFVTLRGLASVPLYILWKLPMYLGFARSGAPKEWVRTGRTDASLD